jgi:SAM-dependent methyltransferase
MRRHLRRLMEQNPRIFNPIWEKIYPLVRKGNGEVASQFSDNEAAFSKIYAGNIWGNAESLSGWGSTLSYTAVMRQHLEPLLSRMGVKTFLDAPCGDLNWMQHVRLPPGAAYVGGDIVPALIAALEERYAADASRRFIVLDIVRGSIPPADLWLCRDVLFHLTTGDALAALGNFAGSEVPFILTTTFDFVKTNIDVRPGGFRYLNLMHPPFNLPEPRAKIPDFLAPAPPRYLALWSREEVAAALHREPAHAEN